MANVESGSSVATRRRASMTAPNQSGQAGRRGSGRRRAARQWSGGTLPQSAQGRRGRG
jgi:hypothetical protein